MELLEGTDVVVCGGNWHLASFYYRVAVKAGLCPAWLENHKRDLLGPSSLRKHVHKIFSNF